MLKYVYWHIIIYFVPNLFLKILLLNKLLCISDFVEDTFARKAN